MFPDQMFHLLRIPLRKQPTFQMSELADKRYEALLYLFRLCYRVIQHSQSNYRKNQVCMCMYMYYSPSIYMYMCVQYTC